MTEIVAGKADEVWVEGDLVKAADRFGDEIWASPTHGSASISFKSVSLDPDRNPWVTLSEERTREFLQVLAEQCRLIQ